MSRAETDVAQDRPPRTDATARLLLLLARETLSSEQRERARALAAEVADWRELAGLALGNFSLPFVNLHLPALAPHGPDAELADGIRRAAMASVMRSLRNLASLARFHRLCVAASGVAHAYVKGPALAAGYYREPGLRVCRDIDLLVAPRDFATVARCALSSGCRFIADEHDLTFAEAPRDLDFMIRHNDVLSILDGSDVHFEVHRKIEKQATIFATDDVLASTEPVTVAGQTVRAMGADWLFCYAAYHHSRHFWSRLHWVADLHAIMGHPGFDRARVLGLAARLGLTAAVEAALGFADLTDKPELWPAHLGHTRSGVFLEACLHGLPGDSAYEVANLGSLFLFDFANPWQVERRRKARLWAASAWHRLRPNFDQYRKNPRPRAMEFLYVAENAAALAGNALDRLRTR